MHPKTFLPTHRVSLARLCTLLVHVDPGRCKRGQVSLFSEFYCAGYVGDASIFSPLLLPLLLGDLPGQGFL